MATENPTTETLLKLHQRALAGMQAGPKKLARAVCFYGEDFDLDAPVDGYESEFTNVLSSSHATEPLVELWRKSLSNWDHAEGAAWTDTEPRSQARRNAIYDKLALSEAARKLLADLTPVPTAGAPVVISKAYKPWRQERLRQQQNIRDWYWPAYQRVLESKDWPSEAVSSLNEAAERVVERLADPTDQGAYQSKGLVVGYVQSGKTANFTGVIAKAIDAGYRLVIVLGGTLNLLRAQTQRRLDMELVGVENIMLGEESDYADDNDWIKGKFLKHDCVPSTRGGFDIVRLTTRDKDYKSLQQGILALEAEKVEPQLPLFDPRNLHRSRARLMVVKKNKSVLAKLVKDLEKIRTPLGEIPVLIIDDESDEASVNTTNLEKPDAERTAINTKISELLRMLPRAQYVGYTATPFANVFVDPSDTEDIFPKDFIISLPRPIGYMGVQDFHDLDCDIPDEERTVSNSQERAHVRSIRLTDDEDTTDMREALDMFVLAGAMKLYREEHGGLGNGYFRHHTMLVHESVRITDHRELRGRLLTLWENGGYMGPSGHERLRELYERDLLPVSLARADGQAVPASFKELAHYIGASFMRIGGDGDPIIVVNGDKEIEQGAADFDRRKIWKILVGGQKLARGFTVEGLTVTYYRRRAGNASTLMQMGRWFGFRNGYQDLVRLYVGRKETLGKKEIDLYEAFEAICRDEETFRSQLAQYAKLVDGEPQVTPAQIPPLVSQHLPWLKPTSPNKMYNAELIEIRSPGQWVEPTAYPIKQADLRHNTETWRPALDLLGEEPISLSYTSQEQGRTDGYQALIGTLDHTTLLALLSEIRWSQPGQFAPHLEYLTGLGDSQVDDWLLIAPQQTSGRRRVGTILGSRPLTLAHRSRRRGRGDLFGALSEPKHRPAALRITGALPPSGNSYVESLAEERRGVVMLYPVVESVEDAPADGKEVAANKVVITFSLVAPAAASDAHQSLLRFRTIDSSRRDAAIVDIADGS